MRSAAVVMQDQVRCMGFDLNSRLAVLRDRGCQAVAVVGLLYATVVGSGLLRGLLRALRSKYCDVDTHVPRRFASLIVDLARGTAVLDKPTCLRKAAALIAWLGWGVTYNVLATARYGSIGGEESPLFLVSHLV